jgi:ribonuclease P protein component
LPTKRRSTSSRPAAEISGEGAPGGAGFRFGRQEHLKKRDDIGRVFRKGRSVACFGAKLFYLENGLGRNRIVFTFARKFGNAVQRNRARRLGKEAFRLMKAALKSGYDLALLLYPAAGGSRTGAAKSGAKPEAKLAKPEAEKAARPKLADRQKQMQSLFKKAGLLC